MTKDEALDLALEALEAHADIGIKSDKAIAAIKQARALDKKAENARELGLDYEPARDSGIVTAGGADPRTQRTWVDLTDDEIKKEFHPLHATGLQFARAVLAKSKEKNT